MWPKRYQSACGLLLFALLVLVFSSAPYNVYQHIGTSIANHRCWTGSGSSSYALEKPSPGHMLGASTSSETTLPVNSATPGFTIFDRLYVRNKTLYAVTSNPEAFPSLVYILSQAKDRKNGENIDPTSKVSFLLSTSQAMLILRRRQEMRIISPKEAESVLGSRAVVLSGTSFIFWDTAQFMAVREQLCLHFS